LIKRFRHKKTDIPLPGHPSVPTEISQRQKIVKHYGGCFCRFAKNLALIFQKAHGSILVVRYASKRTK